MLFHEYKRLLTRFGSEVEERFSKFRNKTKNHLHQYNYANKVPLGIKTSQKHFAFCSTILRSNGFGDVEADLTDRPGLHNLRAKIMTAMGEAEPRAEVKDDDRKAVGVFADMWSSVIDTALTEQLWHMLNRPYYNIYPIVYEKMMDNIDLSKVEWSHIQLPCSPLLVKFPVGREPLGISTIMMRRNIPDNSIRNDPSLAHCPDDWGSGQGSLTVFDSRRGRSLITQSSLGAWCKNTHDATKHMILMSGKCQLEFEIHWADAASPLLNQKASVMDSMQASSVSDCIDNSELRDLDLDADPRCGRLIAPENAIEIDNKFSGMARFAKTGHTSSYSLGLPDVEERKEMNTFLLKLATVLSLIHQTEGVVTRSILESDSDRYEMSDEETKRFLEDRASRRMQSRGHDVGKGLQKSHDRGKSSPHYVPVFWRIQRFGPGNSKVKIGMVRGHWRGRSSLEEVPTGFEGEEQPAPPKTYFRPHVPSKLRRYIFVRDKHSCQNCGKTAKDGVKLEVEHVVAVSKGGPTTKDNLVLLCSHCNNGKSADDPTKFELDNINNKEATIC